MAVLAWIVITSLISIQVSIAQIEGFDFYQAERDEKPCSAFDTVNITNGIRNADGSITHKGVTYDRSTYKDYDYVYLHHTIKIDVPRHTRGCICAHKICIRSCCPEGAYFEGGCQNHDDELSENFFVTLTDDGGEKVHDLNNDSVYGLTHVKQCTGVLLISSESLHDTWNLERKGQRVHLNLDGEALDYSEYCLAFSKSGTEPIAVKCIELQDAGHYNRELVLKSIAMIISVIFLSVTSLVYGFIAELTSTPHGKSLLGYVSCLTIGYSFLAGHLLNSGEHVEPWLCGALAYIIYGAFVASFLWMFVIGFDLWYTTLRRSSGDSNQTRTVLYNLFVWGVLSGFLIANMIRDGNNDYLKHCWLFNNPTDEFYYLYLPLFLIVFSNIIFFVLTALKIRKSSKMATSVQSRRKSDTERFILYLRLFIIMGVTWSMEVVAWIVKSKTIVFLITDLINCLQGPLIFLLFVWNPKVRELIANRFKRYRGGVHVPEAETLNSGLRSNNDGSYSHMSLRNVTNDGSDKE